MTSRRRFLGYFSSAGLTSTLFPGVLYARAVAAGEVTVEMIEEAERLAGLTFTPEQRALMVEELSEQRDAYAELRSLDLPNAVPPAFAFEPVTAGTKPSGAARDDVFSWDAGQAERPNNDEDLAFLPASALSHLLRTRQVTSTELTELYLDRLRRYDDALKAVVTLTEERARRAARQADEELAAGVWRGPLHGVPYGAKDLLSVRGYRTTWGAMPYRDQVIDEDAAVIERLDAAGAVLVAKLTLGALAWGDVWYGGTTKNPWNLEQGSSGSSAGPGAAVAAGLVPFAIGSETYGSIVSPSTRNGVTGHRPTFGAVSRHGAMTLAWTMDKLGPMARTAEDCALVYQAIRGRDSRDPATRDVPFVFEPEAPIEGMRVAYARDLFEDDYENRLADQETLQVLRGLGVSLEPVDLPSTIPVKPLLLTLEVEAAAAFDALTRSGGVDTMVRQGRNTWPHVFRTARFIPAVEYVQANRARTLLMRQYAEAVDGFDVFVTPTFGGDVLAATNLTGHPCVCIPNAFHPLEDAPRSRRRAPGSITFHGGLYKDGAALRLAMAYQGATTFHLQRPPVE